MPQRPINSKAEESCGISRPQSPPSSWVKSVSSTVNRTSSSATNFAKSPTFASSKQITFDSDAMMDSDENAHNGSTWSSFRSTAHPHKHKGEIAQGPWKTAQSNNHSNYNESSTVRRKTADETCTHDPRIFYLVVDSSLSQRCFPL